MLAKNLNALTKLAGRISNASSLTPLYRSIELQNDKLRCCSEFGNIELLIEDTGLTEPCLIQTSGLSGISTHVPGDSDIQLSISNNKLVWKCDAADGKLNLVISDHQIPKLRHSNFPWDPDPNFAKALILASSACQAAAVSIGLYGIVLEVDREELRLLSTNSISLAATKIPRGTFPATKITLRPPVPSIIAALITSCPNCKIDITQDGIFILGDWLAAHLPVSAALQLDLKEIADKYVGVSHIAKVNGNAVKRFIARARMLSDKHASFTVTIAVAEGKLTISHSGISSSHEEYFLCEGLDPSLTKAPVQLPADMLMISLEHIDEAVFDYLEESTLVLRGSDPAFVYVIGGGTD